ncbi:MAG: aldehyde dehydrogenase family protein [Candidatus Tectomicrobia bacterium]|uniref:Aldehyde dehydrogenase family protein n=1 Tax=Tectimicrobiota bacterium TaxID=2528274 RepID=A0A937W3I2_UNCTE|nr:aldehyde dehydrogenase family protein [Candidatus Tectomicrobia bacterium]
MTTTTAEVLTTLSPGMLLPYGGNKYTRVPDEVAAAFQSGDHLVVVQTDGVVLHIPQAEQALVAKAVTRAQEAFGALRLAHDTQIDHFYDCFAERLANDTVWSHIATANAHDVELAQARGRSTTRLIADARMRRRMIEALGQWRAMPTLRGQVLNTVVHPGWTVEQVADGLGVVAFIFEGRPNVFADATGVLRGGNTAVMRIGSDALGTARAMATHALQPALAEAGLPDGAVLLVDSASRAAGWALFSQRGIALAIARGSGEAVAQLGAVARQAGIPVSLHGTGGAWIIVDATADADYLRDIVFHSTDRKVCNTLNVVCLPQHRAAELAPAVIAGLEARGAKLGHAYKLHVTPQAQASVPAVLFHTTARMQRAEGLVEEALAALIAPDQLGHEWEWEGTPEVTLTVVRDTAEAVALFNTYSPRFVASLVSNDPTAHEHFFRTVEAPCVGNGFTRWLDGQFALQRPELGLTNWQEGRLFTRHSILTGDGVYTIRLRVTQTESGIHQ